ncbi:MAG: DUF3048 domain-containing protein [Candidatus Woesebacteria bacterium]|jgi:hypothetical protein
MQKKNLILALVLYIVSALTSFTALSFFAGPETTRPVTGPVEDEGIEAEPLATLLEIDPNAPKDKVCPLNGKYFTDIEQEAWQKRRPLAVMVENHPDARPQSGVSNVDIAFEAVAEGGVTRFMLIYYCDAQSHDVMIAPVRSARTYFIDYASGFNEPMYVHVGGANVAGPSDALGQIREYGWNLNNDMNLGFTLGYPTYYKDYNRLSKDVATEHTGVTSTERLWKVAEKREWTNISPERTIGRKTVGGTDWKEGYEGWVFEEEPGEAGDVKKVSYQFWDNGIGGDYTVQWDYDLETNAYLRSMAGQPHKDHNNNKQVAASNVIVILTTEKGPINEKKHVLYGTIGTGKALIFKNGEAIEAVWSKEERESELKFLDKKGNDIELARGLTWISILPKDNEVVY